MNSQPDPGARRRRNSASSVVAAAQRRGRARTRANGDVLSGSYGVNRGLPPGPTPVAVPRSDRVGRRFEIGLTKDGRIVHLYHTPGMAPQRVVLPGRAPTRRAKRVTYGSGQLTP